MYFIHPLKSFVSDKAPVFRSCDNTVIYIIHLPYIYDIDNYIIAIYVSSLILLLCPDMILDVART